ncbi:hypothetical protein GCM10009603_00960 [Nocardiopsis exhalans]
MGDGAKRVRIGVSVTVPRVSVARDDLWEVPEGAEARGPPRAPGATGQVLLGSGLG